MNFFLRGRFINEFKSMVRYSQGQESSNKKQLVIGEPFEIDYFYETLASLKSELQFKVI